MSAPAAATALVDGAAVARAAGSPRVMRLVARVCGAACAALGLSVLIGWMTGNTALQSVGPHLATMKPNTAVAFLLLGCAVAMLPGAGTRRGRRPVLALATPALLLAVATVLEYLLDVDLGIDAALFASPPPPGALPEYLPEAPSARMALATALALALGAGSTVLSPFAAHRPALATGARGSALALLGIGALCLVGYLVDTDFLYSWYAFGSVAVHTAAGLTVLALGLLAAGRGGLWATRPMADDVRIVRLAAWTLFFAATLTGVASFAVLQTQLRTALATALRYAQAERVAHLTSNVVLRTERATLVAGRPSLRRALARLATAPADAVALSAARESIAGLLSHGFSALAVVLPDGRRAAEAGRFTGEAALAFPLNMAPETTLLWNDGVFLQQRVPITEGQTPLGAIIAEQPLPRLAAALLERPGEWRTAESALCQADVDAIRCLPTRLHRRPLRLARGEAGSALLLHRGLTDGPGFYPAFDYRGRRILGYVGPVGSLGLLAVEKVDAAEVYGPLGRRFLLALLLVALLAGGGAVLVRQRVSPLAHGLEDRVRRRTAALERAVADLRASEARFRALIDTTAEIVWTTAADGTPEDTPSWQAFTGQTVAQWRDGGWLDAVHPEDRQAVVGTWRAALEAVRGFAMEYRVRRRDGAWRWMAVRATPVFSADGALVGWVGMNVDVQDAKDAAAALQSSHDELELQVTRRTRDLSDANIELRLRQRELVSSVQEKEALVKEVHHRVKNNLQMMASLLNLQRHATTLPAVHVAIDEARTRIASIALLHEKLYAAADLAQVDGGEYLRDLAQRLSTELAPAGHVRVEVDADPVPLSADRAIPCGLIVNELVTNAIKHAFADHAGGRVHVGLRASAAEVRLSVGDDGVGLPTGVDPADSPGVGLQLVATFVEQLDGTLSVTRDHGTRFDIRFPAEP